MDKRRKYPRAAVDDILDMLIVTPETKNIEIKIVEISFGGLRFTTRAQLLLDEQISFKIPSLDPNEIITGKIVWKSENNDAFIYGLEISRPPLGEA